MSIRTHWSMVLFSSTLSLLLFRSLGLKSPTRIVPWPTLQWHRFSTPHILMFSCEPLCSNDHTLVESGPFHPLQFLLLHGWPFYQHAMALLVSDVFLPLSSTLTCPKLIIPLISVGPVCLSPSFLFFYLWRIIFLALDFVCGGFLCSSFTVWSLALYGNPIALRKQKTVLALWCVSGLWSSQMPSLLPFRWNQKWFSFLPSGQVTLRPSTYTLNTIAKNWL